MISKPTELSLGPKTAVDVELLWFLFLPGSSALNNVETTRAF